MTNNDLPPQEPTGDAADETQALTPQPQSDETTILPADETIVQAAALGSGAAEPESGTAEASTAEPDRIPELFPHEPVQDPAVAAQAAWMSAPEAGAPAGAAAPASASSAAAAAAHTASGYGSGPAGGASVPPRMPRAGLGGTARSVWSHTLGKVLIIGTGVLAAFVALGLVGGLAFAVTRGGDDHRSGDGRGEQSQACQQGEDGWACAGSEDHDGDGDGHGRMEGQIPGPNVQGFPSDPNGQAGQGLPLDPNGGTGTLPQNPGALSGLDGLLHGEITAELNGAPTVMLVQFGQVTAYTQGSSIAVKSSDGFTATYTISGTSQVVGAPATGVTVRVIATKEGSLATLITVTG
ncbi:MAG: hypothetical protein KBB39_16245 [Phycicoccus sp.]|nr:hypothetical protein [Phycicoccus sp.]